MKNLQYLFAAYGVVWVVIFAYMFVLHRKLNLLQADLDALMREERDLG